MDAHKFDLLLKKSTLTGKEKKIAWELFNDKGSESALGYLETVERKFSTLRKSLTLKETPVPYDIWGEKYIDEAALLQMRGASRLPISLAGALMPDAHSGYGLPIGGVLATDNAVIPYAVGVDIACRMKLTVYAESAEILNDASRPEYQKLKQALLQNTVFGAGPAGIHDGKIEHAVLDKDRWGLNNFTRALRHTAIHQIGTSGGGNHFVEWGSLEITSLENPFKLPVGNYLALLSHSGSRGVGFKIANHYTELAMSQMSELDAAVKHLAWLPLDQEFGKEYWDLMHLSGDFASANHEVIHNRVAKAAGLVAVGSVENHHNFAWKETVVIDGKEKVAIVHRKGATPAGEGVMGIIPGTMADPGYLVSGKGNKRSLNSASHGSGRLMARTQAKKTISKKDHDDYLKKSGVDLTGGGLDEAPQAYKSIEVVMNEQKDLVNILGKFQPKIVRMADETPGPKWQKKSKVDDLFAGE